MEEERDREMGQVTWDGLWELLTLTLLRPLGGVTVVSKFPYIYSLY